MKNVILIFLFLFLPLLSLTARDGSETSREKEIKESGSESQENKTPDNGSSDADKENAPKENSNEASPQKRNLEELKKLEEDEKKEKNEKLKIDPFNPLNEKEETEEKTVKEQNNRSKTPKIFLMGYGYRKASDSFFAIFNINENKKFNTIVSEKIFPIPDSDYEIEVTSVTDKGIKWKLRKANKEEGQEK